MNAKIFTQYFTYFNDSFPDRELDQNFSVAFEELKDKAIMWAKENNKEIIHYDHSIAQIPLKSNEQMIYFTLIITFEDKN